MLNNDQNTSDLRELTETEVEAVAGGSSLIHVNNVRLANNIKTDAEIDVLSVEIL
jgi:hypothetical protein